MSSIRRHPGVIALVLYAILGLIATWPTWPGDPSRIATCACGGTEDLAQSAWFLAWTPWAIVHGHNPLLTGWINVPKGANLADNTSMPLLGILVSPVTWIGGPLAGENLLRWGCFPFSGAAMYWVVHRWVSYAPAAFAAGLLYAFSPYMIGQGSAHLDLAFVPLPPLIFYAAHELAITQRRAWWKAGLLLAGLCIAQFFISPEVFTTTAIIGGIGAALVLLVRAHKVLGYVRHAVAGFGLAAIVMVAILAYPVSVMEHGPQAYVGPSQGSAEVFNADLLGPILPTTDELFAPRHAALQGSSLVGGRADIDENGSYLSIPLIALVLFISLRYWRRRWVLFATFMAIVAFVLSLGPKLTVDGTTRKLSFRLPYSYLSHVKLVNDLLPVRFSLYSALFTAVVLAHGIDACRESIYARAYRTKLRSSGPSWRGTGVFLGRTIAVVLLGASFISLVPRLPFPSTPYSPPWGSDVAALSGIPAGGNVLTYPYAGSFTSDAMGWQAEDNFGFKLFGSYILRPGVGRRATPLAAELSPLDVEAMLTDTLTPIAIPGLPYLAPSAHTIMATRIVVLGRHSPLLRDSLSERRSSAGAAAPGGTAGATPGGRAGAAGPGATGHAGEVGGVGGGQPLLVGTVENVDYATGAFYVFAPHSLDLTGVTVSAKTRYVESRLLSESPTHVLRAMHVAVYGKVIAGTLTPGRIVDLRTFLRVHHVAGIIVQLGRVDSTEVVRYVEDAIGPPTHRLLGGDIWSRVPLRLEGYTGRPVLARRELSTTAVEKASTQA